MNNKETISAIIFGVIAGLVVMVILQWSIKHDRLLQEAVANYEHCVKDEYHTTPGAWYEEHGEYPYCK